jgi:hypothetical protein
LRFLIAFIAAAVFFQPAPAQRRSERKELPPRIIVAMPLAIELGKATRVTLRGQRLDGVTAVRMQEPKSTGKLLGQAKKVPVPNQANPEQVGDSEIEIEIALPVEAPGNVVPFVVIGPGGESKPHHLIIRDGTPVIVETEPNDGFKQAQPIKIPCAVEGSIRQAQDVDVFRFEAKQGEQLVFDLQANRFGSPLDGVLTLYDARGRIVASADDSADSLDPILNVAIARSGTYYLALIDAHDQGGSIFVYRLVARRGKQD